jgi:dihydroneopterin aldolase
MNIKCGMMLRALELDVFIGCIDSEREKKQTISLDIRLHFPEPLSACTTDELTDTICYDTLIRQIKATLGERHFNLIEYLGCEIYQMIKKNVSAATSVNICITKKPPISGLTGGAAFFYGDGDIAW